MAVEVLVVDARVVLGNFQRAIERLLLRCRVTETEGVATVVAQRQPVVLQRQRQVIADSLLFASFLARFWLITFPCHLFDAEPVDITRALAIEVSRDVLAGPGVAEGAGGERLSGSARLAGRLHIQVQIIEVLDKLRLLDRCQGLLVGHPLLSRVELQEALARRRVDEHALFILTQLQWMHRLFGYLILI